VQNPPRVPITIECGDLFDHEGLLLFRQLGGNGQGQNFLRCTLGVGKRPLPIAKVGEARLQMQRERVVDLRADPILTQVLAQGVPPRSADDKLVVDVAGRVLGHEHLGGKRRRRE